MLEWLLASIDPSRTHSVSDAISWHGRLMVLAWGVLAPLSVLVARYFKIMPGQDWPRQLDNATWWFSHWVGQSMVVILTVIGVGLVFSQFPPSSNIHGMLGYGLLACGLLQILLGIFRGSKGGPTSPGPDGTLHGDHYDMTPRRLIFEHSHKTLGYAALVLSFIVTLYGLWMANAPRAFFLLISGWWLLLVGVFLLLQRRGLAVDTYQAIWGPDIVHPGNRRPPTGWWMSRPGSKKAPGKRELG